MPAPLNSLRSNSTGAFTSYQDTHGCTPFLNGASAKADWRNTGLPADRPAVCLFQEVQLRGSCLGLKRRNAGRLACRKKQKIVIAGQDPQSPFKEKIAACGNTLLSESRMTRIIRKTPVL
jgi:hypothetical protein